MRSCPRHIFKLWPGTRHILLLYTYKDCWNVPLKLSALGRSCVRDLFPSLWCKVHFPHRSALLHAGHDVSRSHACPGSLKTTASRTEVYDVFRCWIKKNPVSMKNIKAGSPARVLLDKEPKFVRFLSTTRFLFNTVLVVDLTQILPNIQSR